MIVTKNDKRYFNWLCNMVGCGEKNNFAKLSEKLHNTPFTYLKTNILLSRDSCREDDGFVLRSDFIEDNHTNITNIEGECSVFEMLIACARKLDDLCNSSSDDKIPKWFIKLLSNLGLDKYNDDNYNAEEVEKIIKIFLTRKYDKNGHGGLFPIDNYKWDMRKIDIAMQMHHYLNHHEYRLL